MTPSGRPRYGWDSPARLFLVAAMRRRGDPMLNILAYLRSEGYDLAPSTLGRQLPALGITLPDTVSRGGRRAGGVTPRSNGTGPTYDAGEGRGAVLEHLYDSDTQVVRDAGDIDAPPPVHDAERDGIKIKRDAEYFRKLEGAAGSWQSENKPSGFYTVDLPDDLPVAIALTSDWHVGAKASNYTLLREHVGMLAAAPGVYVVTAGDLIHNHKRQRKSGVALYDTMASPDEQDQWLDLIAAPLLQSRRIIGVVRGNHEGFDLDEGGRDVCASWCERHALRYWGNGGTIRFSLGANRYYGAIRHQYPGASALNTSNNMRRLYDGLTRPTEAAHLDFISLGHLHYNDQHVVHRPAGECHYLRAGAYLEYNDWADEKFGAWKTTPGVPIVILNPRTHEVISFRGNRLALALRVLAMMREEAT